MTTPSIPQTLQDRLRQRKLIPFVGAGVSMAVKRSDGTRLFPSWKQLLMSAADRLDQETKGKEAAAIRALLELDEPDYLYAAQQSRKALGAVWYEYLSNQIDLSRADVADDSLALARAIWELNSQLVLTTNYDRVLRWACPQSGDLQEWDIDAVAEQAQFLRQGVKRHTVWHLHGQIGNKTNLILTPDGYERLYFDDATKGKHAAASQTLRSSLAGYSFLFIGFSLDDEHFGARLKAVADIYEGANGPHYALVKEAHQTNFRQAHPKIEVIPFADFGEPLVQVVRALSKVACVAATADSTATAAISVPAVLPAVSPIPSPQYSPSNPVFFVPFPAKGDQVIGRDEALKQVRKQLTEGRRTAIGQAASFHGLGGLGKTQLAVEYAYRYADSYPNGVIWITADQDIESQLTKLSDEGNWLAPSSEPKQKQDAARHRLRSYSDCLLIFDNLEQMDAIEPYLPGPQANAHILVTSRTIFDDFPSIPLDKLNEEYAYQMLVREAGRQPETASAERAARSIAYALDGLPLALELAGAYLSRPETDWETYYELLQHNPRLVLTRKMRSSFTKHDADLYATLKISDMVFDEEPLLRDIVDLLTWSEAAPMNLSLMCAILERKHESELTTALDLGSSLRLLVKSPKGDGYSLHRLVRQVRREEIPLADREAWVSDVCQRLGDWFQPIREDFSQLAAYEAQLDHLSAWQQNASQHATRHASRLLWLQAYPSYHRGRYREIKELVAQVLQVFVDSKCEDSGLEAHLHNDMGFAYGALGEHRRALAYQEQALAINQKVYGEEHPETAKSLNNVGSRYGDLGEHRKALAYKERALAIRQKVYGEEHPETASSLNNVGRSHSELGDYNKGLEYEERALAIRQKVYGEEHPETASSLNNVGRSHSELGDYNKGLEYEERALAIRQKVYGEEHPQTASSFNNVGGSYSALGDHSKALACAERALAVCQKVYGEEHHATATLLSNFGVCYGKLGDYNKALEYAERALAIRQKVYGEEHPAIAMSLASIGTNYSKLAEHRKGLVYTERALLIQKKMLGEIHPDTISTVIDKATVLVNLSRAFEAVSLLDKTLQTLSKDHLHYANIQQERQRCAQSLPGAQRSKKTHKKKKR
jgi:tetratricopeptide (TPR) repeat protein